jgi:arylformamidase
MVASLPDEIRAYVDGSAAARAALPFETHAYGDHLDERLDAVPAREPGAPLHVFLHGGYWRQLTKDESSFMAPALVQQGLAFATANYTLAPAATLARIVDQCVRAVAWCRDHAAALNADPDRIVLSGMSAGAHLAAMVLTRLPGLSGAALLSGVYDLAPIRHTSVDTALSLTEAHVRDLSPIDLAPLAPTPLVIAVGEIETAEFHRQSAAFADAWRAHGCPVEELFVAGRHHFDLPNDLGDLATPLGQAVARLTSPEPA